MKISFKNEEFLSFFVRCSSNFGRLGTIALCYVIPFVFVFLPVIFFIFTVILFHWPFYFSIYFVLVVLFMILCSISILSFILSIFLIFVSNPQNVFYIYSVTHTPLTQEHDFIFNFWPYPSLFFSFCNKFSGLVCASTTLFYTNSVLSQFLLKHY